MTVLLGGLGTAFILIAGGVIADGNLWGAAAALSLLEWVGVIALTLAGRLLISEADNRG